MGFKPSHSSFVRYLLSYINGGANLFLFNLRFDYAGGFHS
jgi:hypothetical protein